MNSDKPGPNYVNPQWESPFEFAHDDVGNRHVTVNRIQYTSNGHLIVQPAYDRVRSNFGSYLWNPMDGSDNAHLPGTI
jgi:hypothetical protein